MKGIAERRVAGQGFNSLDLDSPDAVISWLGAIQAQDYAGAKWSIGLRLPGTTDAVVEQSISDGTIIRSWALRGTLHFMTASDMHWLIPLLAPRIITKNARRYRQLELDEAVLACSTAEMARALHGGRRMNRQALRDVLEEAGISTEGQRLFYMLQRAALDGRICQGTAPRNNPLYKAVPPAAKQADSLERDEALAELATRYFSSRGPASLDDFVWWSGLLVADAKAGLEAAQPKLVKEIIEGKTYWQSQSAAALPAPTPDILLLPGFDEFLVGYRDRSASIAEAYVAAWSKGKAMFSPSIILHGQVIGLWKRTLKKDHVEIAADLFIELTADQDEALRNAARTYGRFLGKPALLLRT